MKEISSSNRIKYKPLQITINMFNMFKFIYNIHLLNVSIAHSTILHCMTIAVINKTSRTIRVNS